MKNTRSCFRKSISYHQRYAPEKKVLLGGKKPFIATFPLRLKIEHLRVQDSDFPMSEEVTDEESIEGKK